MAFPKPEKIKEMQVPNIAKQLFKWSTEKKKKGLKDSKEDFDEARDY